jgi:hypothetical protein
MTRRGRDEVVEPDATPAPSPRPPRSPRHPTDLETLRTVARVYREALASTTPKVRMAPTAAVARALRVDRTDAARLVAHARHHGLLNPARRRQPGEVPAARPPAPGTP